MSLGLQKHDVLEMSVIDVSIHTEQSFEDDFDDAYKVFGEGNTKLAREYFFIIELVFDPSHQEVYIFAR